MRTWEVTLVQHTPTNTNETVLRVTANRVLNTGVSLYVDDCRIESTNPAITYFQNAQPVADK